MKGEQYLTRPEDFIRVYSWGKWFSSKLIGIKSQPNGLDVTRYGFIVSKRVGKAVVRNRVKRRLREIMCQTALRPGSDIIVSARPEAAQAGFGELKAVVLKLLAQASLVMQDDKKDCFRDD